MLSSRLSIDAVQAVRKNAAFAPVEGPGLLYAANSLGDYWEVEDLTCLAQDSAGTTPVTANDQVVGRVNGKRFKHPMIQTGAGFKPLLKGSGAARYLNHDDNNDWLEAGAAGTFNFLHNGTGCSMWVIGQDDGTESKYYFGTKANTANSPPGVVIRRDNANNRPVITLVNGTGAVYSGLNATVNSWPANTLKLMSFTHLSPTIIVYINGVQVATLSTETLTPSASNHTVLLRTTGATNAAPGDIRAFGVDNRVYSAAEWLGMYQHYQSKGTLP